MHPWIRDGYPYLSVVCAVKHDAGGVNIVVKGPYLVSVVSRRISHVLSSFVNTLLTRTARVRMVEAIALSIGILR